MGAARFIFAPLVAALAFASVRPALVTIIGGFVAVASATLIQFCFRTKARRSQFRHRHVSSCHFCGGVYFNRLGRDLSARRGRFLGSLR
jgi:hypothetical protein